MSPSVDGGVVRRVIVDRVAEHAVHDPYGGLRGRLAARGVRGGERFVETCALRSASSRDALEASVSHVTDSTRSRPSRISSTCAVGIPQAAVHERVPAERSVRMSIPRSSPARSDQGIVIVPARRCWAVRSIVTVPASTGNTDRGGLAGEDQLGGGGDDVREPQRLEELGGCGLHQTSDGGHGTMSDGSSPTQSYSTAS